MDVIAVSIIIFAVITLVVMTGVGAYAIGRVYATDAAKKASKTTDERLNETLVVLKSDTLVVSQLLSFTQERAFNYRRIAEDALAGMPDGARKEDLKRKLQKIDEQIGKKVIELKEREG